MQSAVLGMILALAGLSATGGFGAEEELRLPAAARTSSANVMHPVFAPLDSTGSPTILSGRPFSSARTCGACHDVESILSHNDHWNREVRVDCVACHFSGGRFPQDPAAYEADGKLRRESLDLSGPRDESCAACHGIVHLGPDPLQIPADYGLKPDGPRTYALTLETGEVLSPQSLSESFLNLRDKAARAYPWDAHARRQVACVDCHYAANNPLKAEVKRERPGFLVNDPRRVEFSDYLKRPDHHLAAAECRSCHDPLKVHVFLPYKKRHLEILECRACHVPELHGPAARVIDSTVVTLEGTPGLVLRGYDPKPGESLSSTYASGYAPLLRAQPDLTGHSRLAPYNAVQTFAWRDGATGAAVPWGLVTAAYLEGGTYARPIVTALDVNMDGEVAPSELRLDAPAKAEAVRSRLSELGVADPKLVSTVAYRPIRHGVQAGKQVLRDCATCHGKGGRLAAGLELAPYTPAGLLSEPQAESIPLRGLYVFGHTRGGWTDRAGFLLFLAVAAGTAVHGAIRFATRGSRAAAGGRRERVYLYVLYERIWHWLMAASVLVLMFTGIEIHFAGPHALLGLARAVAIHNFFAFLLAANGLLSLFYHVTTRAIRRFFPTGEGLLWRILEQAGFYTSGIFLGRPHPSPKTPERRLNPLQQVTYLTLLNLLFPLQILTGVLIWGASRWPHLAERLGGLSLVAPLHNLGAWVFLAFFILHLYLTTTGHRVSSSLRAMIDGYEEIEAELLIRKGGSHA